MIICSCNVISDHDVRAIAADTEVELRSTYQVFGCLGCNAECGRCASSIRQVLLETSGGAKRSSNSNGV